jgi:hypothetical protein
LNKVKSSAKAKTGGPIVIICFCIYCKPNGCYNRWGQEFGDRGMSASAGNGHQQQILIKALQYLCGGKLESIKL